MEFDEANADTGTIVIPEKSLSDTEEPGLLTALDGHFDIADLCLLESFCGQAVGLQAGRNGSTSRLVVADGALIHVSSGDLQGLAAFKKILGWKRLEFERLPAAALGDLPPNVRLDASWLLKIAHWRQSPDAREPETCKAEGLPSEVHLRDLLSLLRQKQETGMLTVTTGGRVGALILEDGEVVHAETEERLGETAVEEILAWKTLRATYCRTANRPAEPAAESTLPELEKLIDELTREIEGSLSSGIVRLSDGRSVLEHSCGPAAPPLALYAPVVKSHLAAVELLSGSGALGATEDFLITLEKTYLLIRMLGPDHFHALLLDRSANPALARFVMRQHEPFLLEALQPLYPTVTSR